MHGRIEPVAQRFDDVVGSGVEGATLQVGRDSDLAHDASTWLRRLELEELVSRHRLPSGRSPPVAEPTISAPPS
jgi:hypothetical protein